MTLILKQYFGLRVFLMVLNILTDASGKTKVMLNKEMYVTKYRVQRSKDSR